MDRSTSYYLGIDIGTGSCKAVVVDTAGKAHYQTNHFYEVRNPQNHFAVQNAQEIWQAFQNCCRDVAQQKIGLTAISLSSAMHSLMGVDKEGQPVTPLIIWADKRSMEIARDLRKSALGKALYQATGTPIHSMTPLCKLFWFKQQGHDERIVKWIGIKEYIWWQLFGVYEIDESVASATGLFDIRRFCWHPDALKMCAIEQDALSNIVETTFSRSLTAHIAQNIGLPADTPVMIGASDGCLANLGTFAIGKHCGALTIGTSAAVRESATEPRLDTSSMIFSYILERGTYICGGPMNNGGAVLGWLFSTFFGENDPNDEDYKTLFEHIQKVSPGSEGLLFIPYLLGERAPVWNERATGSFQYIRYTHNRNHFLRAAVEGVCLALNQILQDLEKELRPVEYLSVSGGFVQQPVWVQMLADVTQKELRLYQTEDASCMGAAFLAMKHLTGTMPDPPHSISYKPNRKRASVYRKCMELFNQHSRDHFFQ